MQEEVPVPSAVQVMSTGQEFAFVVQSCAQYVGPPFVERQCRVPGQAPASPVPPHVWHVTTVFASPTQSDAPLQT
jgi:hypothetical protein